MTRRTGGFLRLMLRQPMRRRPKEPAWICCAALPCWSLGEGEASAVELHGAPLWPAGHLPHLWGDWQLRRRRFLATLKISESGCTGQSPSLRGVRSGPRSGRKANCLAFRTTNARQGRVGRRGAPPWRSGREARAPGAVFQAALRGWAAEHCGAGKGFENNRTQPETKLRRN